MAQLSRGRAGRLAKLAVAGSLLLLAITPARAEVDLVGTWHVLVHYKDDASPNPDVPRWDDRLWSFEPSGSRLKWREWPIVVFGDESGRFERRSTGQYARVLHHWEPNDGQQQNIRDGLAVNDRGAKAKTLRKDGDAWRSTSRARAANAMAITYQENWVIDAASGLPAFIREDQLGSASAEGVDGVTEYRVEEVLAGGSVLVGTYQRDGTRHGTFRMTRAGGQKGLEKKSQSEIQAQGALRGLQSSSVAREEVREGIAKELADRGIEVDAAKLDELTEELLRLYGEGLGEAEIRQRLVDRAVREAGSGESP